MRRFLMMTMAVCFGIATLLGVRMTMTPVSAQAISGLPINATCTIQFRRDAMGLATSAAPKSVYDARDTAFQLAGTLVSADSDWLTIKASDTRTHWVSRGSIAMITVDTAPVTQ